MVCTNNIRRSSIGTSSDAIYNEKYKLPELLAPAGSFEHLKAAILAGADAVYLGGTKFGARAYADNFSEEELVEAIQYAHLYNKRIYMTVNTLMTEKEVEEELYTFLKPYYEAGLDGVIVQDMGAVAFIRTFFPKMEIHGSTQMTITTTDGALAAARMGMNRVVPARELSVEEICAIRDKTGLEMEVFVHGALCYCYSGQCLFSATYGGRSGNRGRCAQPCRLPYEVEESDGSIRKAQNYVLSPKDLCTLTYLPEIIENGLDSLKIEGRMKNTEFVAGVVAIYRKYIDLYAELSNKEDYRVDPKDMATLEELFSRSGFTDGYFFKHNGREMMSMKLPNHQGRRVGTIQTIRKNKITVHLCEAIHAKDILVIPIGKEKERDEIILTVPNDLDGAKEKSTVTLNVPNAKSIRAGSGIFRRRNTAIYDWIESDIYSCDMSIPISVQVKVQRDIQTMVKACSGGIEVTLSGNVPEEAKGKPITREDIEKQMKKTGNTPFFLENLTISLEEGLFLPISLLKGLRQEIYAKLEEKIRLRDCRKALDFVPHTVSEEEDTYRKKQNALIVTIYDKQMLGVVCENGDVDGVTVPMDFFDKEEQNFLRNEIKKYGKEAYLSLPRMIREKEFTQDGYMREAEVCSDWDGYYVHHINEAQLLYSYKEKGKIKKEAAIIAAASLYQWNQYAHEEMKRLFACDSNAVVSEIPLEFDLDEAVSGVKNFKGNPSEVLIYGRYPIMVSAQCVNKNTKQCTHVPEQFVLRDAKGRKLPVSTHCRECFNMIWTDRPRDWMSRYHALSQYIDRMRIDLFGMNVKEIKTTLEKIKK